MALPKDHRLRRRQDFKAVYQFGSRHATAHLTLRAWQQPIHKKGRGGALLVQPARFHPTQIGISISQKVSKRAVDRNRIKRQIRAALHTLLPYLAPGWKLVVVVKPSATQCDYEDFLQELEQLLANAEVFDGY